MELSTALVKYYFVLSNAMARKVDVDNLVGASEIAERFGWSHTANVHTIRKRHTDFPTPLAVLGGPTYLWNWPDVEAWGVATGRLAEDGTPMRPARSRRDLDD